MNWSGVLQKADLPHEYVNGDGAKLWYIPTLNCIQLGTDNGNDHISSTFSDKLRIGTVLTLDGHRALFSYLTAAVNRLVVANKEKEMAETVVDEL
jgi:hypothetical protein